MSDSEDDFMSDKFIVPATTSSKSAATYAEKRKAAALASFKKQKLNQPKSLRQMEEEARARGLGTSLIPDELKSGANSGEDDGERKKPSGPPVSKAMSMMLKMGWKPGEGLGKKEDGVTEAEDIAAEEKEGEEERGEKGGIGSHIGALAEHSSKRKREDDSGKGRLEPVRVSMWSGRSGIGTRLSPSPELPEGGTDLRPSKLQKLTAITDDFRARRGQLEEGKRVEGREWAARKLLMEFDEKRGVWFHPLHIMPSKPQQTVPVPLLQLLFPQLLEDDPIQSYEKSSNLSAADALRAQMQADALGELSGDEDVEPVRLSMGGKAARRALKSGEEEGKKKEEMTDEEKQRAKGLESVDWAAEVDGAKRVLRMDPPTHLEFLLSQLREEHFYCFWCAAKYGSLEEMDAVGGCPGESEDDH